MWDNLCAKIKWVEVIYGLIVFTCTKKQQRVFKSIDKVLVISEGTLILVLTVQYEEAKLSWR